MSKRNLIVGALALLATACGGSDPGSGTKTLFVRAALHSDGSPGNSYIGVVVREGHANAQVIQDAVVLLTPEGGHETSVPFMFIQNFKNEIVWARSYRLKISRGNDRLEAVIQPPGLTTITAPARGAVYERASGTPLKVTWTDSFDRRAQKVELELDDGRFASNSSSVLTDKDNLTYDIPPTAWTQATNGERIRVRRSVSLGLAGGAPGSELTAETTHRTGEFTIR